MEEGRERLVLRYLEGYGPAPVSYIANSAGLPAAEVTRTCEQPELRRPNESAA